jgi:hypothetical protein
MSIGFYLYEGANLAEKVLLFGSYKKVYYYW